LSQWAAKAGHRVVRIESEIASGMNGSRGKAKRLLADPDVTCVVVEHKDRLGRMNVELIEAIPVQVAISSADGKIREGYGFDDCEMEYDPDRIYTSVRWKDKADLRELRGQTVKLHFKIKGAALYSYRFTD
jgi:hypothetical protein